MANDEWQTTREAWQAIAPLRPETRGGRRQAGRSERLPPKRLGLEDGEGGSGQEMLSSTVYIMHSEVFRGLQEEDRDLVWLEAVQRCWVIVFSNVFLLPALLREVDGYLPLLVDEYQEVKLSPWLSTARFGCPSTTTAPVRTIFAPRPVEWFLPAPHRFGRRGSLGFVNVIHRQEDFFERPRTE